MSLIPSGNPSSRRKAGVRPGLVRPFVSDRSWRDGKERLAHVRTGSSSVRLLQFFSMSPLSIALSASEMEAVDPENCNIAGLTPSSSSATLRTSLILARRNVK